MPKFAGYWFDEQGIARADQRARFHDWTELEGIEVNLATGRRGAKIYEVVFDFTRIRQIRVRAKPDIWGRPRIEEIASVLALAATGAPATTEFSPKVKAMLEWRGWSVAERTEVRRTRRADRNVEQLLRAARWQWLLGDFGKAGRLAAAAAERDPCDLRGARFQLALEVEQGRRWPALLKRCGDILRRAPDDHEARETEILCRLAGDDGGAEADARAWFAHQSVGRNIALGLAAFFERKEDFDAAMAVLQELHGRTLRSGERDRLEASIRFLARLKGDAKLRRRLKREAWWRQHRIWSLLLLWAAGIAAGYVHQQQQREAVAQAIRDRQAAVDRAQRAIEQYRRLQFQRLVDEATKGDVGAMMRLEHSLMTGDGGTKNPAAAIEWCLRAAEKNHLPALIQLARIYDEGAEGIAKDPAQARQWFARAAKQGSAEAAVWLGDLYFEGRGVDRDYGLAVAHYRQAADRGNLRAKAQLGWCYEQGLGVGRDYVAALQEYRPLAENDDAWAQNKVGWFFWRGLGVEKNPDEAVVWFRQAAEKKNGFAQSNLGLAYESGRGVVKDVAEAAKWQRASAEQGNTEGCFHLARLLHEGIGVPKDSARAAEWLQRAAEKNHPGAQTTLARVLLNGDGVPRDPAKARQLAERAERSGFTPAKVVLGECYLRTNGAIPKDFEKARMLFHQAALMGDVGGLTHDAVMCRLGLGGAQDLPAAEAAWRQAADKGDTAAMLFLAQLLAGAPSGIPQGEGEAMRLLQRAADRKNPEAVARLARIADGGLAAMNKQPEESFAGPAPSVDLSRDHLPEPIFEARPHYPSELRYLGMTGEVLVDFLVDPSGRVQNAYPVRSTASAFEAAAVEAVKRWRFIPAVKDGLARSTHLQVPIVFTLNDDDKPTESK